MSVSEPSWLFGKIWISTRPLVSCLMRSIASTARTLSGCAVGELLAYLSWNSAAPLAIHGIAIVAPAAVPASSTERRVVLNVIAIPPADFRLYTRLLGLIMGRRRAHGKWRCVIKSGGERSMANSVTQRAAIVTGGASGIGLATVECLIA